MWAKKCVVVAGGSKGLGLRIAKAFHDRGSQVVLLARSEKDVLDQVNRLNQERPESAMGFAADLSCDQQRGRVIEQVVERTRQIDVWVNAVGQSTRIEFSSAEISTYRHLMEQNFFVSVGCSLDVLDHLKSSNGYLINIGSLAAKTGWKLLGPYVTSKHALAGFAHQLRIEGPENVHTLFVCPGPIAGSDLSRYSKPSSDSFGAEVRPGAGAPVKAIAPDWLAKKIVESCERGKNELVIPLKSRLLFSIVQLWPALGDRLIRRFCK